MSLFPHSIEITVSGPTRAASEIRYLVWSILGSNVVHAALLTVASIVPMQSADWFFSAVPYNPPSGDNTVQLTAAFMDSAAANPPAEDAIETVIMEVNRGTNGLSELAPQVVEVSPLGSAPTPQNALPDAENFEEAAGDARPLELAKKTKLADQPPEPVLPRAELPREVANSLPAEVASTPSLATAAVAAPLASGAKVDVLPSAVYNPFPSYPPELLAKRIQGTVVLRLRIAADGTVTDAAVQRTSGFEAMDQAALAGVRAWKFKPATREGKNVETVVLKPFTFEIRE